MRRCEIRRYHAPSRAHKPPSANVSRHCARRVGQRAKCPCHPKRRPNCRGSSSSVRIERALANAQLKRTFYKLTNAHFQMCCRSHLLVKEQLRSMRRFVNASSFSPAYETRLRHFRYARRRKSHACAHLLLTENSRFATSRANAIRRLFACSANAHRQSKCRAFVLHALLGATCALNSAKTSMLDVHFTFVITSFANLINNFIHPICKKKIIIFFVAFSLGSFCY